MTTIYATTTAPLSPATYYGNDTNAYYVASNGSIWALQIDEETLDRPEQVGRSAVPSSMRVLPDVVCRDFAETVAEIESGVRPTAAQIEALRSEAAEAGDMAQVRLCDRAEDSDVAALAECARVLRDAAAQV